MAFVVKTKRNKAVKAMRKIIKAMEEGEIFIEGKWRKRQECEIVLDKENSIRYGIPIGKWVKKPKKI